MRVLISEIRADVREGFASAVFETEDAIRVSFQVAMGLSVSFLGAFICDGFDDERFLSPSKDGVPSVVQARVETQVFGFAQVTRVIVHEAGSDFERFFLA